MKSIRKITLMLGAIVLNQASASIPTETEYPLAKDKMLQKKDLLHKQEDVDRYTFNMDDYRNKGPYSLEEESEDYLEEENYIESAKLFLASAIKGNVDTREYFRFTFEKSPKDLAEIIKKPKQLEEFIKNITEDRKEEHEKMEAIDDMEPVSFSEWPTVSFEILKK